MTLLTPQETADLLRISLGSLAQRRVRRQGPPFTRVGRLVRYRQDDLERWLNREAIGR